VTRVSAQSFAPRGAFRTSRFACGPYASAKWVLLAAVALVGLLVPQAIAQAVPQITKVNPSTGMAGAMVTITGKSLDKSAVSGVYLSDDKTDHKATVVSQSADTIVITVPRVKAGDYNVSFQEGASIYIQPARFTVQ
jgi:IPT/TIG domain